MHFLHCQSLPRPSNIMIRKQIPDEEQRARQMSASPESFVLDHLAVSVGPGGHEDPAVA